jgi:ELWxxDGT repeat protein
MISRPPRTFSPLPPLLASLALASVSISVFASAHAQEQTARLVKDANRTPGDFKSNIGWVMPVGKRVVFPMDTLAHGSELWISNGTAAGTRLLKDILPGPGGSYPEDPEAFGGDGGRFTHVAFRSQRNATGNEVWVTDGTPAGTVQIFKSPNPGSTGEVRVQAGTLGGVFFENIDWEQDQPYEVFFSEGTAARTWSLNPLGEDGRQFIDPYGYVTTGAWCFFIANGNEIWRTDGQTNGTTKEFTITAGPPERLGIANERLFVEVGTNYYSSELWTSPWHGDELTRIEFPEGAGSARIEQMITFGDELYFIRVDELNHRELWATNGTAAGTRRVLLQQGGQGEESHVLRPAKVWNGALYLPAYGDNGDYELWRTDGTPAGTRRLASFTPPEAYLEFYETPATEDFLYFQTSDSSGHHQLWRTKGDAASTRPVKGTPDISPGDQWPQFAATESGGLFFVADRSSPDQALWRLRGKTHGGVRLTKPEKTSGWGTAPSPVNAQPYEMQDGSLLSFVDTGSGHELWRMKPNGSGARSIWKASMPLSEYGALGFHATTPHGAIFTYDDGADVRQVWVTDGTKPGTRLLGDHGAANNGGRPHDFVKVGDTWFYSVVDHLELSRAGLWKTDGTPEGTTKVVTSDGTAPGPLADEMVAFQGQLYFLAAEMNSNTGLWRSDGTAAGTVLVKNKWYPAHEGFPENPARLDSISVAGGELIFSVRGTFSDALWHSDGTAAGTAEVLYPGENFFASSLSPAVDLNGAAIFQGSRWNAPGIRWWRHDATGTTPLRADIPGQHASSWYASPRLHAVAGTQLFYNGIKDYDAELWVTDGTNAGTRQVKDIYAGSPGSSYPREMLAVGNVIYFSANDDAHGAELWRSDGTEAGTVLVADIQPGREDSSPQGLKVMDGKLYFSAQRRDVGRELFVIDLPER